MGALLFRIFGLAVMFLAGLLGLAVEPKATAIAVVVAVAFLGLALNLIGWALEARKR